MSASDDMKVLTRELIESHGRCHYPYMLTASACTLQGAKGPQAGISISINSEVFGRIASASRTTWQKALSSVVEELDLTRDARMAQETEWKTKFLARRETASWD